MELIAYNLRFRMFGERHENSNLSTLILQMEDDKLDIIKEFLSSKKKIYINLKDGLNNEMI